MSPPPRRRALNVSLLVAGVASTVSGFLIQSCYHMNHDPLARQRPVWGWGYSSWALFHQISSIVLLAIVGWHLVLNQKPLLATLKRVGAWRRQGPLLFAFFTAATVTALVAWTAATAFDHGAAARSWVEIHDKLVIPMSVLLALHVWQRRRRLVARAPGAPRSAG